ncbi:hypothetical protein CLOM_g11989 [Closterium sp. NIES-68]|nr:hypothetical protein CLOM_g11989 [Closterium sp. NIES-68]
MPLVPLFLGPCLSRYRLVCSDLWLLRRPVYGLRQAPREWHDTLRATLADLQFFPSSADPSLFVRAGQTLILARFVATGRHRPQHWSAAKRVLRYLASTSGMGLWLD